MILRNSSPEIRGKSEQLVVFVHAYTSSRKSLRHVRDAVAEVLPDADLLRPDCPAGLLSNADPVDITEALLDAIDGAVDDRDKRGGSYQEVIMIGHSLGALLVRKAYVFARGQTQDSVINLLAAPRKWVSRVSRIVLLAGTNRGWSVSPKPKHMSWLRCLTFRLSARLAWRFHTGRLIRSVARGAPFVTNLRIQWINLVRDDTSDLPPATIQLLGNIDDIVSSEDNVDIQSGSKFFYKRLPNTGHLTAIDFSGDPGRRRKQIFIKALTTPVGRLQSDFIEPLSVEPHVDQVVFVIHGIRDRSFWTEDIRDRIKQIAKQEKRKLEVVISSYGYFPMLPFLFFGERQKNVRWFMDKYTEALARYPKAKMDFIGHSNGTYLLASALKSYKACQFHRIVFAGSVVPTSFPWEELAEKGRVKAIRNYVATSDWIVGVFPGLYELLRVSDLGSAGHNGFQDNKGKEHAIAFFKGGHDAAICEDNYDAMIRFVIDGKADVPSDLLSERRSPVAVWVSKLNWLVWLMLVILLGAGAVYLASLQPLWLILYVAVLYAVLHTT